MPYGYRPQRPGIVDPNDPRRKRLPLTPEEDPYGGIVPDFEVDLPEPVSPLPQVPLTQPSTIGMQTGAKLPMEQWQTPPRDLTSLRAWYSGAAEVPGAPPAPEWGKRTPTYSRLNPPPPRQMQAPTPAPSPTAPVGPLRAPAPNLFGQLPSEQFGQRMQQLGVSMQPAASPPVTPPAAGSGRQAFNQFMQSLGTGVAGIPRGVAAALEETLGAGNVVPEQWRARTSPIQQPRAVSTALQAPTQAAEQQVRQAFPVNPQDQSWLTSKIPAGLGSAGAFVASAAAGRALGVPANVTTATAGTGMAVNQFLNEIEQTGIDPRRYTAGVNLATVSGLSELVGFGRLLDKFGMKRRIIEQGLDILQDSGQEAFQGFLEDLNAKLVAANDPSRNIDPRSSDFWLKRGEEAALGAIVSAPLAGVNIATDKIRERRAGGADKVPDVLQDEAAQRYQAQIEKGIPRAPLSMVPGVPSQRQGPGFTRVPSGAATTTGPQGPPSPQRPAELLPPAPPVDVQAPISPTTPKVAPEEAQYRVTGEWPVPLTFRTPVQLQMRRQQGPDTATTVGMGLEDLRNEYEMTGEEGQEPYFTKMEGTRARRVKRPPTARDVQGEHGYIAERMYHAPSLREFIDKGGAAAYGVKPEDNAIDAYERIVGGIAAEMTELTGVPYSISDVQNMRRTAGIGKPAGWQQWFEAYGKARGLDTERDMDSILAPTTGKQMGAMMPSSELENIFGVGGKKAGQADRGAVQEALQEDIAKLFNIPFDRVSLTQVTPVMWKQWAAVRNISPEGVKQLQQVIRAAEEFKGRTRVTPKEAEARKERAKQPVSEWYEQTYGRPTSLKGKPSPPSAPAGAAPAAPTRPTPPSPAAPAAPTAPTAPSPLVTRYQSQVGRGVSRAPLAFQPRSYTEGVASIERDRAEREEARRAQASLKRKNPFAKARQAEEAQIGEVIEGRRPEPPAATEPVTPKPTPPAPPAPAGEAVTPDAMKKAGIDVPFMESLAKKYGMPPIPVVEAEGINAPLGRAANMLERAASKSKSSEELAEILKRAQRMKAHRAVFAVAQNPSTDESTFEKAIKDKEANKYVSPSYWDGLRAKRAERAGAGIPSTPAPADEAVTPPTPRKATPVKKESAPKPAAPTGQPITEKSLTEQGWTKNSSTDFRGPNGERLERDANRRGEPWVYTDRSGNTESFASAREAIQGILSSPAATPAPETPVTPKTTKPRKAKAEAAPVPQTTQEEEGELPVAEFARQQEQVAARREAFLKDNPDLILTAEDYVKTLAPDVQQRYAKYKALQAKFEAAKQAGSQVRFGATSGKQLKELTRELEFISKEVGRAKGVLSAVIDREPVNVSTVDALGIKLPEGYQRQGNQFVYEEKTATPTPATTEQAVAEARKLMRELAAELNLPENLPLDKLVSAAQKKVREAEKAAPTTAATEVPTEVRQIFDTLDSPQGKKSKTRKSVEAMNPNLGKKAIFVNDNIEQIIAEAEANGKVTKECP